MERRRFLALSGRTAGIATTIAGLSQRISAADAATPEVRVRHSVCRWCYRGIPLEDLCVAAKEIGIESVELIMPPDFPVLKKHGLECAMVFNAVGTTKTGQKVGAIEWGFNRIEHHDALVEAYGPHLEACAQFGAKQVICFSGNRRGIAEEQGLENCATGLKRLMPLAEKLGITLVMELLNSKVNHRDYQCDHTQWGIELCKRVGSQNLKLLYDIYHMQIMEGDIVATIQKNHQYFSHYHTGGVPGRNEIDETQEINYPAVIRAILATGYTGFVGQEFIPKRPNPIASLKEGVQICTV